MRRGPIWPGGCGWESQYRSRGLLWRGLWAGADRGCVRGNDGGVEVPNYRYRSNFVGLNQSTKQTSHTGL